MQQTTYISTPDFWLQSEVRPFGVLSSLAQTVSTHLRRPTTPADTERDRPRALPILTIDDRVRCVPFIPESRTRAIITTWQSAGICFFSGLTKLEYLTLCSVLALTQLKALARNPLLKPEDLVCKIAPTCLFSRHTSIEVYALIFERGFVCQGCRSFYHCLGADRELLAIQAALDQTSRVTHV